MMLMKLSQDTAIQREKIKKRMINDNRKWHSCNKSLHYNCRFGMFQFLILCNNQKKDILQIVKIETPVIMSNNK